MDNDEATRKIADAIAKNGRVERFRIVSCTCGQKNRIDVANVIGHATRPLCGKCGLVLRVSPFKAGG